MRAISGRALDDRNYVTMYFATAASFHSSPRPGPRAVSVPSTIFGGVGEDDTGEIEKLEPVRGRRYREHVGACFGEQMARYRNVRSLRLRCDLKPAGDAAALHQIGHDEVAGAGCDRFTEAAREPPVLAGLNWRR